MRIKQHDALRKIINNVDSMDGNTASIESQELNV